MLPMWMFPQKGPPGQRRDRGSPRDQRPHRWAGLLDPEPPQPRSGQARSRAGAVQALAGSGDARPCGQL